MKAIVGGLIALAFSALLVTGPLSAGSFAPGSAAGAETVSPSSIDWP
ncbi:hypothetical protein [Streptomyces sp. DW26H14]